MTTKSQTSLSYRDGCFGSSHSEKTVDGGIKGKDRSGSRKEDRR